MIPLLLLFVTATFRPETPTIGDLITIDYSRPVTIEPSPDFELVSQQGGRVVVRTFQPRPIVIHAHAANDEVGDVIINVKSVLAPNDALKPAPLAPPRSLPATRVPWIAIGVAALVALLAWVAVWLRARRLARPVPVVPSIPADERFRIAVGEAGRSARPWAALADATRAYLAAIRPDLGLELTTTEVLLECGGHAAALVSGTKSGGMAAALQIVLEQGDLEKFSPWGAPPLDFDNVARKALELAA
jgi:hypothetical protein